MRGLKALDAAREKLEECKARLAKEELTFAKRRRIACEYCKQTNALGKWGFIQDHWYVAPYSCSGGDYWKYTDTECCHLVCPSCGKRNYIYNHPAKARILELTKRPLLDFDEIFAEVLDQYGDGVPKLREN